MRHFYFVIFLLLGNLILAQTTTGLLSYDITQSYQGYTLIYPHFQPNVYLLNNCGEIVHTWEDDAEFVPGNTAYLKANGDLVKTKRSASIAQDSIWAGGGGAIVEIRSWENDLKWTFELNNADFRLHHDITLLPNGNIVMIAWERKTRAEAIEMGRDSALLNQGDLWPDYLFEINPETDEIVWEWHSWDHLVQDFDSTKANYGNIADFPDRININWDTNNGASDWMHANSLDYNEELDHLMLSVPQFHEIWMIDHSTTTEQAAGSFGGRSNNGGDLLYRTGNNLAFARGDTSDQILFYQHDAHWIDDFVPETHPYYGQVMCFNNRIGPDFSTVEIFDPLWQMYSVQYDVQQGVWAPDAMDNTLTHPNPQALYSTGLSSSQLLPNGNFLICGGRRGYIFEMTPSNEIVWEYVTPLRRGVAVGAKDTLNINENLTFRAFRYPPEFEAFEGRVLEAQGFIESEPEEDWCARLVSVNTPEIISANLFPNPAEDRLHLSWDSGEMIDIEIVDMLGRSWYRDTGNGGMKYMDVAHLESQIYFIKINGFSAMKFYKQ